MKLKITTYSHISASHISLDGQAVFQDLARESFDSDAYALYKGLGIDYPKFYKMDAPSKLGFLASELLLKKLDLKASHRNEKLGIVLYGAAGCLDTDLRFQETISDATQFFPSPSLFVYTLPNILMGEICIRNKFEGENYSFVAEQPDPTEMERFTRSLFEEQLVAACLLSWTDFTNQGTYASLMFLIEKEEFLPEGNLSKKFSNFEAEELQKILIDINNAGINQQA